VPCPVRTRVKQGVLERWYRLARRERLAMRAAALELQYRHPMFSCWSVFFALVILGLKDVRVGYTGVEIRTDV
jgi:hypothetical protein